MLPIDTRGRIRDGPIPRLRPDPFIEPVRRVIDIGVVTAKNAIDPPSHNPITRRGGSAFLNIRFNTRPRIRVNRNRIHIWVPDQTQIPRHGVAIIERSGVMTEADVHRKIVCCSCIKRGDAEKSVDSWPPHKPHFIRGSTQLKSGISPPRERNEHIGVCLRGEVMYLRPPTCISCINN